MDFFIFICYLGLEIWVLVFLSFVEEVLNGICKVVLKDIGVIFFMEEIIKCGMSYVEFCML